MGYTMGYIMGYIMEQQWGMLWSNNRAYHGAVIGHSMEQ